MGVFLRGKVYWYKFMFQGQIIRESSNSPRKDVALRLERDRRQKLELGLAGLKAVKQPIIFARAAKEWLEFKRPHWAENSFRIESKNIEHLTPHFGKLLLSDIEADDVSGYQAARKKEKASPKTVNLEIGTLRAILRRHRLWANLQPDVRLQRVREDVGRALSADEEHRLMTACQKSRSRSLYVAVLFSLHTGLRSGELRLLRWRQVDLLQKSVTVGKSKTSGGEGRVVPISETLNRCLVQWRRNFPEAKTSHYVFPTERYGLEGDKGYAEGVAIPYDINPEKPIGSWKVAWTNARKQAGVECRWHDMRHSFVSRMAESQASDATIMALSGHMSRKMMERYSHVRGDAKRRAISALDRGQDGEGGHNSGHSQQPA